MNLLTFWWGCVAVLAYAVVWVLTAWALRPQIDWHPYPDWFWTGGAWVQADEGVNVSWVESIDLPEVVHGQYESFKPEPSDQPESKPESGAG